MLVQRFIQLAFAVSARAPSSLIVDLSRSKKTSPSGSFGVQLLERLLREDLVLRQRARRAARGGGGGGGGGGAEPVQARAAVRAAAAPAPRASCRRPRHQDPTPGRMKRLSLPSVDTLIVIRS